MGPLLYIVHEAQPSSVPVGKRGPSPEVMGSLWISRSFDFYFKKFFFFFLLRVLISSQSGLELGILWPQFLGARVTEVQSHGLQSLSEPHLCFWGS